MKPMLKNGSSTGTAPKKAYRRPRWLGPLLEDPMYRRMRKALIREIAPVTVLDWVEAEEYVMSQFQSMRLSQLAKSHFGTFPMGWHQARHQTSVATEMSIGP